MHPHNESREEQRGRKGRRPRSAARAIGGEDRDRREQRGKGEQQGGFHWRYLPHFQRRRVLAGASA